MTRAADFADAVHIVGVGPVVCAAVPWRNAGQLRLTVVVKASFAVVPDGDMTLAEPVEIHRTDVPQRNNPTLSAGFARETAPYLPRADVVLTGSAYAPEGTQVPALTVRFALFRDRPLLEKRIHVYGDRRGQEIVPWSRIPLVYERAYGGLGHADNPFGTGNKELSKPPNLVDPADPTRPACFAPLSASWPTRKRLLGKPQYEGLRRAIPEVGADFDWSYFQAAPPDQRVDHLAGDEWVVFDGMHPELPRVQSRLPGARAFARVFGLSDAGRGQPLGLVADMLAVDADEMVCSVVWRAGFPIPGEEALGAIRIVAGVETASAPIDWEAALAAAAPAAVPEEEIEAGPEPEPEAPKFEPVSSTIEIAPAEEQATRQRKLPSQPKGPASPKDLMGTVDLSSLGAGAVAAVTLPFQPAAAPVAEPVRAPLPPPRPPPPSPSRPQAPPPPLAAQERDDWAGTLELSSSSAAKQGKEPALPFAPPPAAQVQAKPQLEGVEDWAVTVEMSSEEEHQGKDRRPLPFVQGVANLPPPAPVAESQFTGTVTIGDKAPAQTPLPFQREPRQVPPAPPPPALVPPPSPTTVAPLPPAVERAPAVVEAPTITAPQSATPITGQVAPGPAPAVSAPAPAPPAEAAKPKAPAAMPAPRPSPPKRPPRAPEPPKPIPGAGARVDVNLYSQFKK
jgi:hypothetical protein